MKVVKIGDKWVGDKHPCFISVEPGATHTGLKSAKRLAKAAKESGVDAVKFQTLDTDELMSIYSQSQTIEYKTKEGWKKESLYNALKRRELTFDEWRELKEYCDKIGILFISAPSGPKTVDLLADINSAAIKILKSDVNNRYLIRLAAKKHLPIILDAREKFQDVEAAIQICEDEGNDQVIIMHCPSGYPTEHAGIHLNVIPYIKGIFGRPVAYSDHSLGDYMNYAALGMGVNFIEKTISLNKNTDAVEHFMSLEPEEIKIFVERIRSVEQAFGNPRVIFSSRVKIEHRRSIVTKRDIMKGEKFTLENIKFQRPGNFLSVERYEELLNKKAIRDIPKDNFVRENDFE